MEPVEEIQSQIQPHFTTEYHNENRRCIDWDSSGLIAYATGTCVNLSYAQNSKLTHIHSIEIAPYTISSLRFHPTNRTIAIGDSSGRLFLWEIDNRRFIASAKPLLSKADMITCIQWKDDLIIALLSSKKLVSVKYTRGSKTDKLINFSIIWKITLPRNFTDFSFDPFFENRILFYGYQNIFSIYSSSSIQEAPVSFLEEIELNQKSHIKDAQWSFHLPNFILILVERDMFFFNIESRSLIPLIDPKSIISEFLFITQFQDDHTKFITFHKHNVISIYEMRKNMYTVKANIQCKLSNSTPVSAVLSPLNDRYLTVFYDPIGLSFFDLKKTRITSIDPTFPSEITSYDSDGTWYVLGTKTGYLIFGNLYDTIDMKRFKVSTEPITFLLYDTPKLRVYWQTNKDIGIVDLGTRKVTTFKSHGTIIKCYGSHHGAIIVQRDSHVLGIFIEGKERPLILKSEIIDLSIDEMYSNQKSGKFYVLQRDHTVMFYTYSLDGIQFVGGIRPRQIEGEVLSLATFNELFVIGYNDGSIKFYNSNTQESSHEHLNLFGLQSLQFGIYNNILFGISNGRTLFKYENKTINICPYLIQSYKVINNSLLLIKTIDSIVKFIRISDWKQISNNSKYLPAPTEDENIINYIRNRKENQCYSSLARDSWIYLNKRNETIMRLHTKYCTGKNGEFEKLYLQFYRNIIENDINIIKKLKFSSLIFLGDFKEAAELLFDPDPSKENFLYLSIYSIMLLMINNNKNELDENVKMQLKTTAMSLFSMKMYEEGSFLLKIAGYDKEAAVYLMEDNMYSISYKFIRNMNNVEDHKELLIILGCKWWKVGNAKFAIPMFAGAEQFHPVLYIMFASGMIVDVYFLMKKVKENGLLKPLNEKFKKLIPQLTELDQLCMIIEQQFNILLKKLGINK